MAIFRFDPNARSIRLVAHARNGQVVRLALALDTGATQTTIPLWAAKRMGLQPSPTRPSVLSVTAEGMVTSAGYELPHLQVLGQSLDDLEVITLNLPAAAGVHGLLGLSFLRHFRLFINFPKGKLALLPGASGFFRNLLGLVELARVYW